MCSNYCMDAGVKYIFLDPFAALYLALWGSRSGRVLAVMRISRILRRPPRPSMLLVSCSNSVCTKAQAMSASAMTWLVEKLTGASMP